MTHPSDVVPKSSSNCLSLRSGTPNAKNPYPNYDCGSHAQKDDNPSPNSCDLSQNDLRKTLRATTRVELPSKLPPHTPTNKHPLKSRLSRLAPLQTCSTPDPKTPGTKRKGATRNQRRQDTRRLNNQARSQGITLTAADVQDICAKRRRLLAPDHLAQKPSSTRQPANTEPSELLDSTNNTLRLLGYNLGRDDDASVTDELNSRPSDSPPSLSPPPTADASSPPAPEPSLRIRTASPSPLLTSAPPTHSPAPLV